MLLTKGRREARLRDVHPKMEEFPPCTSVPC
jgi:hypothetical protein